MAGFPPLGPPPIVPGITAGGGAPAPSPAMPPGLQPPDQVGSILDKLKNRRGSAAESIKQAVTILESAAALDPSMTNRIGAALAILRGPARPGERPDGG